MVKFLGGLGDNRVKNVETPTFLPEDNIRSVSYTHLGDYVIWCCNNGWCSFSNCCK